MILKLLAALVALLVYYVSPYGPDTGSAQAEKSYYLATVTKVADGDTLTVRNSHGANQRIRLHAIDSPELKQANGEHAKNWLTQQVMNKQVKIVVANTDRYKRQVAKVVLPKKGCEKAMCEGETDINLKAIEEGHAWWYREFARTQSSDDRALYETAENQARATRKGLWQQRNPKAPWKWRTEQRNQGR